MISETKFRMGSKFLKIYTSKNIPPSWRKDWRKKNFNMKYSNLPLTREITSEFFSLSPPGLPKSCQGIRDSGIGTLDGQYIIEAREGCHISVICINMNNGADTKEFLGGPSEAEWKYWHYAVLIKISESDKRNIPEGACLEFSGTRLCALSCHCESLFVGKVR